MNQPILIFLCLCISQLSLPCSSQATDATKIWQEFIGLVERGEFTADRIRPHFESIRQSNFDFIKEMEKEVPREELEMPPEIIRFKDQINYLIPLTFDSSTATYCLSFIEENETWYLRHIEAIFIRLDKITVLPTSDFPDLSDTQKAWAREEIEGTRQVEWFNFLAKEKGRDFAFNWFKDGVGYYLAAQTWVPFVEPRKAFILYLCWEQAKLRGNEVILEKLDDQDAVAQIGPQFIKLYMQTSHLKQQISFEDYVQLFTTIWQDRAAKAGWNLEIIGGGWPITFHFKADSTILNK
jgi:hypothetical protein